MRIADSVYVLPIPRGSRGADGFLNLTLILDEQNGNTLVDAGLPGQAEAIGAALAQAGIGVRHLRRIIFTHQDLDHVGSGAALVRQSGATVIAHPADAPHIDGTLKPLKPSPEMLEQRPQMREALERLEPVRVDEHVEDGDRLDLAGRTRVIFTPGHTPGHLSVVLRLKGREILVAGDAMYMARTLADHHLPYRLVDEHLFRRSLREIELYSRETPDALIIPGHDWEAWQALDAVYE
jgi:glyoxylase-like metal-dependent hydrolase (beta-lactamase superfamily II)